MRLCCDPKRAHGGGGPGPVGEFGGNLVVSRGMERGGGFTGVGPFEGIAVAGQGVSKVLYAQCENERRLVGSMRRKMIQTEQKGDDK